MMGNRVLVGNKCDLDGSGRRQVGESEGSNLAKEWGCGFMETSAKDQINNQDCFYDIVRAIRQLEIPVEQTVKKKKRKKCAIL